MFMNSKDARIIQDPNDANKYYFNGVLFNVSNTQPVVAQIDTTLQTPFITKANEYDVSVVRLFVAGNSLPIFRVPVLSAVPPYFTKYITSMTYNGFTVRDNVVFTPVNDVNALSNEGLNRFDIYTYQQWLDDINASYLRCFNDLATLFPSGIQLVVNGPPVLIYDVNTNLISVYVEQRYQTTGAPTDIGVFMNRLLFDFFTSFEALYDANQYGAIGGQDCQLKITPTNTTIVNKLGEIPPAVEQITGIPPNSQIWRFTQEYASVYSWNIVKGLIITSDIGVILETLPNVGINDPSTRSSIQMLTDFEFNFDPNIRGGGRNYIQYLPQAQYRLTSLAGAGAINRINVKVQYLTFDGRVENLILNPNFSMSVKLLFQKKATLVEIL